VPLVSTNPKKVFQRFEKHIVPMVGSVLPLPPAFQLVLKRNDERGTLELTRGGVGLPVPIETNLGGLYLSLNQDLVAVREGITHRLRTQRYQYKILPSDDPRAEALIRWEFDADTADDVECRNHLHVNTSFPIGLGSCDLKRVHVPTAWVLIEHVLRFLFHDLAVPAKTSDWPKILRNSEPTFYEKFSGKRYRFRL
jgi:hypothetical protein